MSCYLTRHADPAASTRVQRRVALQREQRSDGRGLRFHVQAKMQSTQGQQHAGTCRVARHRVRRVPVVSVGCRGVCAMGRALKGWRGSLGDVLATCKYHNNISCHLQSGSIGYPTGGGKSLLKGNLDICKHSKCISFASKPNSALLHGCRSFLKIYLAACKH